MPHPGISKKEFDKLKMLPYREKRRPDTKFLNSDNPDALWAPAVAKRRKP